MISAQPIRRGAGAACGVSAYLIWGFIALYFKLLSDHGINAMTVLGHRVVWSLLFCVLLMLLTRRLDEAASILRNPRIVTALAITSLLIAINWLAFIYSVETHQLNQSALGYFINPLVSVLLGLIVLHEKLRPWQWASVVIASIGVCIIIAARGQLPWIGITVAISFGLYGLMRKITPVGPIVGLTIETAILVPLAIAYLFYHASTSTSVSPSAGTFGLLILSGAVTSIPLLLFAFAARNLRLSTLGFLQYIAPTCQLLLAIFVGNEQLSSMELVGFVPIWVALIIFSAEAAWASQRSIAVTPPEAAEPV